MRTPTLGLIAMLGLGGCGDDGGGIAIDAQPTVDAAILDSVPADMMIDSPPGGPFTVTGTVTGTGPMNPLFVIWVVESSASEYLWKYGEGTSTATTFMVTMSSDPPAQAVNLHGVAVGFVVMAGTPMQIPDGIIDKNVVPEPVAFALDYTIVFKTPSASGAPPWSVPFPTGYSCGTCTRGPGGNMIAPAACSSMVLPLMADKSGEPCDWF